VVGFDEAGMRREAYCNTQSTLELKAAARSVDRAGPANYGIIECSQVLSAAAPDPPRAVASVTAVLPLCYWDDQIGRLCFPRSANQWAQSVSQRLEQSGAMISPAVCRATMARIWLRDCFWTPVLARARVRALVVARADGSSVPGLVNSSCSA